MGEVLVASVAADSFSILEVKYTTWASVIIHNLGRIYGEYMEYM